MREIDMGIVLGTIIYKAGARRANKKRDKKERARSEKSANRAMHEYYNGDTSAMEEYYANR
jgi:hypothetical protein